VSTLYALANLLEVSTDDLLGMGSDHSKGSSADVARSDVQRAGDGPVIEMENGVRWERLAMSQGGVVEALLITYDPGASSSVDGRLMRHAGIEYGYMLEGVLTLQIEFDTYELLPGDSLHFESSRPHLLANRGVVVARGVWFVVGRNDALST